MGRGRGRGREKRQRLKAGREDEEMSRGGVVRDHRTESFFDS